MPVFVFIDVVSQAMPNLSPGLCKVKKWIALPNVVAMVTVQVVLFLRVLVFCRDDKKLARFSLVAAFLIAHVCWATFSLIAILRTIGYSGGSLIPGCLYYVPRNMYLTWLLPMLLETILTVTTIYKAATFGTTNRTVAVLARDSIVYFIGAFCILLVDLIYWEYGKAWTPPALITPGAVFACVGASRLAMNLRAELWLGDSLGTMRGISRPMAFARFAGNQMTVVRTGEETMSGEVIPDETQPNADP